MAERTIHPSFVGNATLVAGNGVRLLASSNVYLSNGTRVNNGNAGVYFTNYVQISSADAGNLAFIAAANSTLANLVPFGAGFKFASGVFPKIDAGWITAAVGNLTANANDIYVSVAANMTVTITGF